MTPAVSRKALLFLVLVAAAAPLLCVDALPVGTLFAARSLLGESAIAVQKAREDVSPAMEFAERIEIGSSLTDETKALILSVELGLVILVGTAIVVTLVALKPYWDRKSSSWRHHDDPEEASVPRDKYGGSSVAGPSGITCFEISDDDATPLTQPPPPPP